MTKKEMEKIFLNNVMPKALVMTAAQNRGGVTVL